MRATALIAAAALACGSAAFAQQATDTSARGEESARVDQQDHGQANDKMRNGLHRLGEKTRHAMHSLRDKAHRVAHNDRRNANDTRAMGASGSPLRDADSGRRQRMDEAYSHWKSRQDKQQNR